MQQINLYTPELRPQRDWLNAQIAGSITLAFIVLMLAMQLTNGWQANSLENRAQQQQQTLAELQARVDKLQPANVAATDQVLEKTIADLEKAIAVRQKVGRIISGQNMGNSRGFHASLQALARESRADLALERFTLSRGGNYVEMRGKARTAEAVPLYLQRLKGAQVFGQTRFGLLSVSSEQSQGGTLDFALGYDNVYKPTTAGGRR